MKAVTKKLQLKITGPIFGGTLILPENQAERLVRNIVRERKKQPSCKNTGFITIEFQRII
jgi:hypothetical protein